MEKRYKLSNISFLFCCSAKGSPKKAAGVGKSKKKDSNGGVPILEPINERPEDNEEEGAQDDAENQMKIMPYVVHSEAIQTQGAGDEAMMKFAKGEDILSKTRILSCFECPPIPLCHFLPYAKVRGLQEDLSGLKVAFGKEGYVPEKGVFIVSICTYLGETTLVDEGIMNKWDPLWIEINKEFEEQISSNPTLGILANHMFYVWEGNHRIVAWMDAIQERFSDRKEKHVCILSTIIDPRKVGKISLLSCFQRMNFAPGNGEKNADIAKLRKFDLIQMAAQRVVYRFFGFLRDAGHIPTIPLVCKQWVSPTNEMTTMYTPDMFVLLKWEIENCPWWIDMTKGQLMVSEKQKYKEIYHGLPFDTQQGSPEFQAPKKRVNRGAKPIASSIGIDDNLIMRISNVHGLVADGSIVSKVNTFVFVDTHAQDFVPLVGEHKCLALVGDYVSIGIDFASKSKNPAYTIIHEHLKEKCPKDREYTRMN
ncbi:hypothetical protein L7F22_002209 [Adiantum nelumboides]|nr:hypothetical protein [Adiantum nelumboides]